MIKLGRRGTVIGARELGPYGLLLRASSRDDLEGFARGTLAPLAEFDRRHGAELTRTLRVFLEEDRVPAPDGGADVHPRQHGGVPDNGSSS